MLILQLLCGKINMIMENNTIVEVPNLISPIFNMWWLDLKAGIQRTVANHIVTCSTLSRPEQEHSYTHSSVQLTGTNVNMLFLTA